MTPLTAWSYSRLSTYEKCALQAKLKYIDKLPEPPSDALERGSEAHDVLAQYLRGDRPLEEPGAPSEIPGWAHFGSLLNDLRALEPQVEQEWGFNRAWKPVGWFGRDTWFRSKLDASLVYGDDTGDVIDFKTGKPYPQDTAKQAELYAISMVRRYPALTHATVRFWYVDPAQRGAEAVYRFSRGQAEAAMPRWEKKAERMLTDEIMAPRPGEHCKRCPFANSKGGPCKYS
jgi:RecB family exonuclease